MAGQFGLEICTLVEGADTGGTRRVWPQRGIRLDAEGWYPKLRPVRRLDASFQDHVGDTQMQIRRQKVDIELEAHYADYASHAELMELHHNRRALYINSNAGQNTIWSASLIRSEQPLIGEILTTFARATKRYSWNESRRMLEEFYDDFLCLPSGGPYNRYLQMAEGNDNLMLTPKPMTPHGGVAAVSGAVVTFNRDSPGPVLNWRDTSDDGVWMVELPSASPGGYVAINATGLSTSEHAVCGFFIKGQGTWTFAHFGGSASAVVALDGDWQFVQLRIDKVDIVAASIVLTMDCADTSRDQLALLGPISCFQPINQLLAYLSGPFWAPAGSMIGEYIYGKCPPIIPPFTFNVLVKYADQEQGIVNHEDVGLDDWRVKISPASGGTVSVYQGGVWKTFPSVLDSRGISFGDWFDLTVRVSSTTLDIAINGLSFAAIFIDSPTAVSGTFIIGSSNTELWSEQGGIGLMRYEQGLWSEADALWHYYTYLHPQGLSVSRQLMGRVYTMKNPQFNPVYEAGGPSIIGDVTFEELYLRTDLAAMQQDFFWNE